MRQTRCSFYRCRGPKRPTEKLPRRRCHPRLPAAVCMLFPSPLGLEGPDGSVTPISLYSRGGATVKEEGHILVAHGCSTVIGRREEGDGGEGGGKVKTSVLRDDSTLSCVSPHFRVLECPLVPSPRTSNEAIAPSNCRPWYTTSIWKTRHSRRDFGVVMMEGVYPLSEGGYPPNVENSDSRYCAVTTIPWGPITVWGSTLVRSFKVSNPSSDIMVWSSLRMRIVLHCIDCAVQWSGFQ